ncbi:hypothetical protein [uncultured Arcticibacterium sp.]
MSPLRGSPYFYFKITIDMSPRWGSHFQSVLIENIFSSVGAEY